MNDQIVSSPFPKPLYQFAERVQPEDVSYAAFIVGLLVQYGVVKLAPDDDGNLISAESVDDWRLTTQILANCIAHLRQHTEQFPGDSVELPFKVW